ncbi:MAG TPA: DUF192 domain-containing protein [Actinomycetota bacterium]|nr:DUF192 domain-containing protein [Actinomycetota bacterium]
MRRRGFRGPRSSAWTIDEPDTRRERMRGARDLRWLTSTHGVLFRRCRSVHTFGMREPIVVAALDARLCVVHVRIVRPRRLWLPRTRVRHVLEARADADVQRGDRFFPNDEARPERRRGEGPTTLRPTRR